MTRMWTVCWQSQVWGECLREMALLCLSVSPCRPRRRATLSEFMLFWTQNSAWPTTADACESPLLAHFQPINSEKKNQMGARASLLCWHRARRWIRCGFKSSVANGELDETASPSAHQHASSKVRAPAVVLDWRAQPSPALVNSAQLFKWFVGIVWYRPYVMPAVRV